VDQSAGGLMSLGAFEASLQGKFEATLYQKVEIFDILGVT